MSAPKIVVLQLNDHENAAACRSALSVYAMMIRERSPQLADKLESLIDYYEHTPNHPAKVQFQVAKFNRVIGLLEKRVHEIIQSVQQPRTLEDLRRQHGLPTLDELCGIKNDARGLHNKLSEKAAADAFGAKASPPPTQDMDHQQFENAKPGDTIRFVGYDPASEPGGRTVSAIVKIANIAHGAEVECERQMRLANRYLQWIADAIQTVRPNVVVYSQTAGEVLMSIIQDLKTRRPVDAEVAGMKNMLKESQAKLEAGEKFRDSLHERIGKLEAENNWLRGVVGSAPFADNIRKAIEQMSQLDASIKHASGMTWEAICLGYINDIQKALCVNAH